MIRAAQPAAAPIRVLHLHGDLAHGAPAACPTRPLDAFRQACEPATDPADFPSLAGGPTPRRLQQLAQAMVGHDLVLTYGYGAMAAVMAHTVFAGRVPLPPLVHHEEDAGALTPTRNWYRRIALGRAAALVVPSQRLAAVAVAAWHQPAGRVQCIAPGIRIAAYAHRPRRDVLPRIVKRPGELWLGTCADRASATDLLRLVRAFAALPEPWQFVIMGAGDRQDVIREEALRLGLSHRVHLAGDVGDPAKVLRLFDLFALLAVGEPLPLVLIEAMAAGLAVVAGDVGDVAVTLAPDNRAFVVPFADDGAFAAALRTLAAAPELRANLGAANRARAQVDHDQAAMVSACRAVYAAALGRQRFP